MPGTQGIGTIFGEQTISLLRSFVHAHFVRPIRQNTPEKFWFVTSRTLESRFFLKPDPQAVEIVGFFLARALRRFPAIRLAAFVCLSNHWHMVLQDQGGDLYAFLEYFIGNLAREINVLRGRSGTVFP
ncbi:MAG: hypothetical protein HY791_12090, partial [Deltaproteobacteria bacterium]|nr:hypothetical protein [Deltaproteobacteria bacterium]